MAANFFDTDWSILPVPIDDGAADHLKGLELPPARLPGTDGATIDLSDATLGRVVLYIYPLTGTPGAPLPDGWDEIPGARGCTPQSCSFRDHADTLNELGVDRIFGISTQPTIFQTEVVKRLHLPFPLLSDNALTLRDALKLPSFDVKEEPVPLLKRMVLLLEAGRVAWVWYPVFPPDISASLVIDHLKKKQGVASA